MKRELVEYDWNPKTGMAELTYDIEGDPVPVVERRAQPLRVTATKECYWEQLLWYLKTQGAA